MSRFVASTSDRSSAMSKPSDSDVHIIQNLNGHDHLAHRLGQFVAVFAGLEVSLWKLYGKIIGNELGAIALLGSIQSFAVKLDAVERFVLTTRPKDKRAILDVLREARDLNTFRNDLFHGSYMQHNTDRSVWLFTNMTDPSRRNSKKIHLTDDRLKPKIEQANKLSIRILNEFFAAEAEAKGTPITLIDRSRRSTAPDEL